MRVYAEGAAGGDKGAELDGPYETLTPADKEATALNLGKL
jgi:hypothetical protein